MSEYGATDVVTEIHKGNSLSLLRLFYTLFYSLISCLRRAHDTFRNSEVRCESLVTKFFPHGADISISEMLLSQTLLINYDLDGSPRPTLQ